LPACFFVKIESSICNENVAVFQATLFQTLPLQQGETQVSSASSQQNSQTVTDVIQQLLGLSEPGTVEARQSPQPGQQLSIAVGINQDILQVKHACLLL
jgi:hypothetical protein